MIRVLLAGVFAVAAVGKLLDRAGSAEALHAFGAPPALVPGLVFAIPALECLSAAALLVSPLARWGAVLGLGLLVVFSAAIGLALRAGRAPDCHCFGQLHSEPAGPGTLIRNGVLAAGAVAILAAGPGRSLDALSARDAVDLVLVALVAMLAVYAQRLRGENVRLSAGGGSPAGDSGVTVGMAMPPFALPEVTRPGAPVTSLAELAPVPRPLALVFTSTRCPVCQNMYPAVRRWQAALADQIDVVVISSGPLAANAQLATKHGIARMLAQPDRELNRIIGPLPTPSALLLGPRRRVLAPPAIGPVAIEAMLRRFRREPAVTTAGRYVTTAVTSPVVERSSD